MGEKRTTTALRERGKEWKERRDWDVAERRKGRKEEKGEEERGGNTYERNNGWRDEGRERLRHE